MIKSQKDQGNQLFKNGKYSQAIKHYKLYLQQSHEDNKNAFFNLSLCFSKLGKHKESIEAAGKAVSLDPNYTKCYYRLALENKQIGNQDYQVFINASRFLKLSGKQQISERQQMKKIQGFFKNKLRETLNDKKINNLDQILNQTQALMPQHELRLEVDKEINEWIVQWDSNTQDEEAKLLEIRYIMEEIDYDYGLNVAYFYLNQISNKQQKLRVQKEINSMRKQLNREQPINLKQFQAEEQLKEVGSFDKKEQSEDDENLFQIDEKVQQKQQPKIFNTHAKENQRSQIVQHKNNQIDTKTSIPLSKQTPKTKNTQVKPGLNGTKVNQTQVIVEENLQSTAKKTPKQKIQQLLKNKQRIQENFVQKQTSMNLQNEKNVTNYKNDKKPKQIQGNTQTKTNNQTKTKKQEVKQALKDNNHSCGCSHQHNHSHQPLSESEALQKRKSIVQQLKNAFPSYTEDESSKKFQKFSKPSSKKEEQKKLTAGQIQEVYNQYCGWLASQKNKFVGTYKCVLKILESQKISGNTKGELLVLLKKRVKNFIIIMRSNSENEQKVLYSLLTKHGIQQYANDITPVFYTP